MDVVSALAVGRAQGAKGDLLRAGQCLCAGGLRRSVSAFRLDLRAVDGTAGILSREMIREMLALPSAIQFHSWYLEV